MKEKKRTGCLIPLLCFFALCVVFTLIVVQSQSGSENNYGKSILAKTVGLDSEQETAMVQVFESCGIGEITSATVFQEGEDQTSYHMEDQETAAYNGVSNTIVVWVNNTTKTVEAIYFNDYDIYKDGTVLNQITQYYVSSSDREKYRVSAQMAVNEVLSHPDTATYPAISGWKFGVLEDDTVGVQSSVTAENDFGVENTLDFQVLFQNGNITSLIVDGREYLQ
jgi:hypothetical protein